MSLWEQAVKMKSYNGGNMSDSAGDYIYIGEFSGGVDEFDEILDKFVGGLDFDSEEENVFKEKKCKVCPYIPQKKSMEWTSSFIKNYLKSVTKYT